ncbi:response regulator transcription factor [uncultured Slackia sp.]|uniref:response regulator transcription factor n=1 Tax=uncultured Slackia sp. TaxID=665903 RepID=UPI0025E5E07B|nr:helix-turn-helix transcriptional regulator [uncultured Slackia sp.]
MQFTTANQADLRDFSAGPTLLDAAKAPYRLGWAFLLAWVFCVFYLQLFGVPSGDALIAADAVPGTLALFFDAFPVFVSIATLAAVIAAERRLGPPSAHPRIELAMAVIASVGTPLLLVSAGDVALTTVLFAAASLLTGIGSGVMWVSWGEHYARIPQEDVELFGPVSAVLGALITLGVSAMSGWVVVAVVASFPLLSGLCLFIARKEDEANGAPAPAAGGKAAHVAVLPTDNFASSAEAIQSTTAHTDASPDNASHEDASPFSALAIPATMGRTIVGIMVACLFVCVAGALVEGRNSFDSLGIQIALLVSTLFTLAIAFISVVGPRRISISFFYRWMCPALVLGFAAIILFGDTLGSYLAFTMSVAARFAFCLITQMYFARVTSENKMTAVQAYGWGWISVHLGDFLGVLATAAFAEAIADSMITLDQVAAASMAALVVATMFVIDDKRSFASPADNLVAKDASTANDSADIQASGTTAAPKPTNSAKTAEDESAMDADPSTLSTDDRIASIAQEYGLTRRESEVFALLARGRSVPYVRDALVISRETAATHAKHIYAKLGVHSRQELIDLVADYRPSPAEKHDA